MAWGDRVEGLLHGADPAAEQGAPSPALLPAGPAEPEHVRAQEQKGKAQKKSKDHNYLAKRAQSAPDLGRKKGGDGERMGIAVTGE